MTGSPKSRPSRTGVTLLVLISVSVLAIAVAAVWPGIARGPDDRARPGVPGPSARTDPRAESTSGRPTEAEPVRRLLEAETAGSPRPRATDDPTVVVTARWRANRAPAEGIRIALVSPGFDFHHTPPSLQCLTDSSGEARFEAVTPGPWLATATRDDAVPLSVVAGEPCHVEVLVEGHGAIQGSVRDEDDRPVAGVRIQSGGHSVRGASVVARTRKDGSFSFRAPGPDVLVWAESSESHSRSREVALVTYEGERHFVELVVARRVTTLRGRVLGADGRPVPGAEVIARDSPPPSPTHPVDAFLDLAHARASCDPDGRFAISGLRSGLLSWRARAPGHLDRHGSLAMSDGDAGEELRIDLPRGASVSGTVRTPDGQTLSGVRVTRSASDRRGTSTDPDGRFAWDDLEAGPRVLHASHPRWGRARVELELQTGEQRRVDLVLEPGLVLEGRVVDRSGAAVTGVVVVREDAMAVTAADGSFRFVDCEDRAYELVVHARLGRIPSVLGRRSGVRPHSGAVEFVVDDPRAVTASWIRGRFERPRGHEDAALRLELRRGDGPGFVTGVPQDGSWVAGPLQSGTWNLRALAQSSPLDSFQREGLRVDPGETLDLGTVALPAPTTVQLAPETDSGAPLTELRVIARPLDAPGIRTGLLWRHERTTPLRSFAPGRWQIDVAPTERHLGTRLVVELAPGVDNIVTIPITRTRPCRFRVVGTGAVTNLDGSRLLLRGAHDVDDIALRNGMATLGVPLGEHMALVEGEGFHGSAVFHVDSVEGPALEIEIRAR